MSVNYSTFEKSIKSINERIKNIANELGTDSKLYNDYISRVNQTIGNKYLHQNKNGIYQISHGKSAVSNPRVSEMVNSINRLDTLREYRQNARESLIDEGIERPTREEVQERMQDINDIESDLEENLMKVYESTKDTAQEILDIMHKSHKTYSELSHVMSLLRDYDNRPTVTDNVDIYNLFKGV